jgi:nicotinamidase-related amidase
VSGENKKRCLIVVDAQNEYFTGLLAVTYPKNSLKNILKAVNSAKSANIPVVFVQHTAKEPNPMMFIKNTPQWELHDSIKDVKPDFYIEKHLPSAFSNPKLEKWLRKENIDTVAICGYATQFCCDTTARYAFHLGFNVEFLSNATATKELENKFGKSSAKNLHKTALIAQSTLFSKVLSVDEWMKEVRNN